MLSILGCTNGAQVEQFLKQIMVGYNVSFEPGLCSAINKGIFVHSDNSSSPKNFSPFLTPPVNDDARANEHNNILKLAVQTKYRDHDVDLLTKMEVPIPMDTQELCNHLKNFTGLARQVIGAKSIL